MKIIMSKKEKAIQKIKTSPKHVRFEEIESLLLSLGFVERQASKGSSHFIFVHPDPSIDDLTIVKPHGKKKFVALYQVKQAIRIIDSLIEGGD